MFRKKQESKTIRRKRERERKRVKEAERRGAEGETRIARRQNEWASVWEKSGVTVYKRHNATRSRLYVPNGSNKEPSFAISSRILRSFSFFHFPSPPVLSSSCRSKVKTYTWPRLSSSRIPKTRSMQETVRMRRAEDDAQSEV